MKNTHIIPIVGAILMLTLISSCNTCDNTRGNKLRKNSLWFRVYDKDTKENLLLIGANIYDRDTVRVLNENMEIISRQPVDQNGSVWAYPFTTSDEDVLDRLVTKTFYIYFNHQDTDTIQLTYNAWRDDCDDVSLKQVSVIYNDSIYVPLMETNHLSTLGFYK